MIFRLWSAKFYFLFGTWLLCFAKTRIAQFRYKKLRKQKQQQTGKNITIETKNLFGKFMVTKSEGGWKFKDFLRKYYNINEFFQSRFTVTEEINASLVRAMEQFYEKPNLSILSTITKLLKSNAPQNIYSRAISILYIYAFFWSTSKSWDVVFKGMSIQEVESKFGKIELLASGSMARMQMSNYSDIDYIYLYKKLDARQTVEKLYKVTSERIASLGYHVDKNSYFDAFEVISLINMHRNAAARYEQSGEWFDAIAIQTSVLCDSKVLFSTNDAQDLLQFIQEEIMENPRFYFKYRVRNIQDSIESLNNIKQALLKANLLFELLRVIYHAHSDQELLQKVSRKEPMGQAIWRLYEIRENWSEFRNQVPLTQENSSVFSEQKKELIQIIQQMLSHHRKIEELNGLEKAIEKGNEKIIKMIGPIAIIGMGTLFILTGLASYSPIAMASSALFMNDATLWSIFIGYLESSNLLGLANMIMMMVSGAYLVAWGRGKLHEKPMMPADPTRRVKEAEILPDILNGIRDYQHRLGLQPVMVDTRISWLGRLRLQWVNSRLGSWISYGGDRIIAIIGVGPRGLQYRLRMGLVSFSPLLQSLLASHWIVNSPVANMNPAQLNQFITEYLQVVAVMDDPATRRQAVRMLALLLEDSTLPKTSVHFENVGRLRVPLLLKVRRSRIESLLKDHPTVRRQPQWLLRAIGSSA